MRKSDACLDVLNLDRGAALYEVQFTAPGQPPEIAVLSATPQLSIGDMASGVAGLLRMKFRCATKLPACFPCVA